MKRHVTAIALLLLLAGIAHAAKKYRLTIGDQSIVVELEEVQPDPPPVVDPPAPPKVDAPRNIQTMRDAGWNVSAKLIEHPAASDIKAALLPPQISNAGSIAVKRLWMPRQLANYDPAALAAVIATKNSPHRSAMRAWYALDVQHDTDAHAAAMNEARAAYFSQCQAWLDKGTPLTGFVRFNSRITSHLSAVLALDWIVWTSADEYERAFALAKAMLDKTAIAEVNAGDSFASKSSGYWNNNQHLDNTSPVYSLLALSAYGINPSGASHAWASQHIDGMPLSPYESPTATYSPWHLRSVSEVISMGNGGGREWGAEIRGPGYGGYEAYFAVGFAIYLHAADTATGGQWKLTDSSYLKTRHIGLVAQQDGTVEQTEYSTDAAGAMEVFARLAQRGEYSWLGTLSPTHRSTYLQEFQALAGPKPQPVAPSGPFFDLVGTRLHFKSDLAEPDSAFRGYFRAGSIDNHRETGDDRCMAVAIGSVGLVDGHANRSVSVGTLANGIFWGPAKPDPLFADVNYWDKSTQNSIFRSDLRFVMPSEVLSNPAYLRGLGAKPKLENGAWVWTRDWSDNAGVPAKTSYKLSLPDQHIEITDEIQATGDYIGWHFSPSHEPVLTDSGFSFGDGTNSITVTVSANVPLTPTVRKEWDLGYRLPLEWHSSAAGGSMKRIAANVGFTPAVKAESYRVTTVIEAK